MPAVLAFGVTEKSADIRDRPPPGLAADEERADALTDHLQFAGPPRHLFCRDISDRVPGPIHALRPPVPASDNRPLWTLRTQHAIIPKCQAKMPSTAVGLSSIADLAAAENAAQRSAAVATFGLRTGVAGGVVSDTGEPLAPEGNYALVMTGVCETFRQAILEAQQGYFDSIGPALEARVSASTAAQTQTALAIAASEEAFQNSYAQPEICGICMTPSNWPTSPAETSKMTPRGASRSPPGARPRPGIWPPSPAYGRP